ASLISANKVRLRYLAEQGNRSAQMVNRVLSKPEKFFSTILLTENAFIIFASSFGTAMAITLLRGNESSILIATAVMTVTIVAFGEITPKTLAARSADRWSLLIARPIALIMTLETPVIFFFTILPRVIVKFFGGQGHSFAPSVTEGELRMLINISRAEGTMDASEAALLEKVFHFGDRQVREVMTPRPEIVWIERGTTLKQFFGLYAEHSHTRFPVYEGAMENVVGILSNKDVMLALGGGTLKSDDSVTDLLRTAYFVPETKTVSSTFAEMQREGHGLALTVNEFGGIAGVATLNQLLEVIVGEVRDEHSDVEQEYTPVDEHTYNVMASIGVSEINDKLGLNIPEGHYETLAGFLLEQLGYIPVPGEVLQYDNLTLTVKRSNGVRIEEVEVKKSTPFAD
ncbi:MAG: HlyC/CorC family transporter, partial [Chloroflexi bacterium]|nr:HlyC/CorC family transporter [Chloroflexota bacterium]